MIKNCKITVRKITKKYTINLQIQELKIERLYIIIKRGIQRTTKSKQNAVNVQTEKMNNKLSPQIFVIL